MLTTDPGAGCQFVQGNTACARLPSALGFPEMFPIWVLTRLDPIEWWDLTGKGRGWNGCGELARLFQLRLRAPRSARLLPPPVTYSPRNVTASWNWALRASATSGNKGVILNKKIFIANLKLSEVRALFKYFYNNCKDRSYNNGSTNAVRQKQER